jgi:hypothetical protein
LPSASHATNLMYMPFETVLSDAIRAGRLDGSVKFYLIGNGPQGTQQLLRRDVVSDLRTNGFNKSDHDSCEWVLQSNLIKLQADAKRVGANAVVNIVSYYDQHVRKDLNTYECRAGVFVTRVALKGDLVRLPEICGVRASVFASRLAPTLQCVALWERACSRFDCAAIKLLKAQPCVSSSTNALAIGDF